MIAICTADIAKKLFSELLFRHQSIKFAVAICYGQATCDFNIFNMPFMSFNFDHE